jgi:hypothetical protein
MIDVDQQLGVSMAKHKHYDYRQTKMLPISFDRQILPGTFEHTLSELIDSQVDLSVFGERYKNDAGGAPAHDPAIFAEGHSVCRFTPLLRKRVTKACGGCHEVCEAAQTWLRWLTLGCGHILWEIATMRLTSWFPGVDHPRMFCRRYLPGSKCR